MINRTAHLNGHAAKNGQAAKPPLSPSANGTTALDKDPESGRFLPGNKAGRGNPHYRRLAANRTAFLETIGPEQVKALAAGLYERALHGDVDAARLVFAYAIGRPLPAVDADAADLDEWRLRQTWPTFAELLEEAARRGHPYAQALDTVRRMVEDATPKLLSDGQP